MICKHCSEPIDKHAADRACPLPGPACYFETQTSENMAHLLTDDEPWPLTEMKGMDWANDSLFYTHKWRDETSGYDPHPTVRWEYGSEYYSRQFKARVPIAFKECAELCERFITLMVDEYPDTAGFWVD
jgi:hypothetical protein